MESPTLLVTYVRSWEMKMHDGSERSLAHIINKCFWKDNAWQSVYILKRSLASLVLIKINDFL